MKALEFYAGIGGMHAALLIAAPEAKVACAYEINEVANDVYEANFGMRPRQVAAAAALAISAAVLQLSADAFGCPLPALPAQFSLCNWLA